MEAECSSKRSVDLNATARRREMDSEAFRRRAGA